MKDLIITLLIVLTCSIKTYSQVVLTIQKINISGVYVNIKPNEIVEGEEDGPYVHLFFSISNGSDKTVKILPKLSKMYLNFQMKDQSYSKSLFPLFQDKDSIMLKPHEQYTESVGDNIFLGTKILKDKKKDYCRELIEAIPTIKVEYISKDMTLVSSGVDKVIVL